MSHEGLLNEYPNLLGYLGGLVSRRLRLSGPMSDGTSVIPYPSNGDLRRRASCQSQECTQETRQTQN